MTPKELTIRKSLVNDVETIVRVINAGGPGGQPRSELPDELPESYRAAFQLIDHDPNQLLMVAECEGIVIGTFHLTFLIYLSAAGQPDALLEAVHVVEDYRGRGVGRMMMDWAIQEAKSRNCRRVQLTTDKRRTEAHSFYKKVGFDFSHEGAKLYL